MWWMIDFGSGQKGFQISLLCWRTFCAQMEFTTHLLQQGIKNEESKRSIQALEAATSKYWSFVMLCFSNLGIFRQKTQRIDQTWNEMVNMDENKTEGNKHVSFKMVAKTEGSTWINMVRCKAIYPKINLAVDPRRSSAMGANSGCKQCISVLGTS